MYQRGLRDRDACMRNAIVTAKADWIRATLEPVILETIAGGATYGYDIARAIQVASDGRLLAQEGTLYPALHRLEKRGYLRATWKLSPEGRRRKHYALTAAGRRQLETVREEWASFSRAVNQILGTVHVGIVST
ncbi:MAG: PadR family transcriptional regulator [Planctomycetota bacterium]|nr:MAG: PadR family transcriptional regulator [Planctomycetota bacterium]